MAVTGRDILNFVLVLIDEVTETGTIASETPGYYEAKVLSFLTMVQAELLPVTIQAPIITSLDDELLLDNNVALRACTYGVASKVAIAEDMNLAVTLNAMYDELKKKIPVTPIPIEDVYNVSTGSED